MTQDTGTDTGAGPGAGASMPFGSEAMVAMLAQVADAATAPGTDDATRIDAIAALEAVKAAAGAAQARVEIAFRDSQLAQQSAQGVARKDLGRGIADQIALARRMSPKHASDQLALRRVLVETLPKTTSLLARGEISEWAAHEVAKNVLVLDDEDRHAIDTELADTLPTLTAPRAGRAAKQRAQELDPAAAVKRAAKAVHDRRVTVQPAPDTMVHLTALLPVAEGVATFAALDRHATTLRGTGDPRGRGQIMADTLVEAVTGQGDAGQVPIEVQLLMSDTALLAGTDEPALLEGHPIPGAIARHLALGALPGTTRQATAGQAPDTAPHGEAQRWVRRLYTHPATGELTTVDPRRRLFSGTLRRFIALRDQNCRTPWCDASIRDLDHVRRYADGGPTDAENGAGVCERFNHVKEMPGWTTSSETSDATASETPGEPPIAWAGPQPAPLLQITTPTGHTYTSRPPALRPPASAPVPAASSKPPEQPAPEWLAAPTPPPAPPDRPRSTRPAAARPRPRLPGPRTTPPPRPSRRTLARARQHAADLDDLPATTSRNETELTRHLTICRRE